MKSSSIQPRQNSLECFDHICQGLDVKRFRYKKIEQVTFEFIGEGCNGDDWHVRPIRISDMSRDGITVHPGHTDIGDHQIELTFAVKYVYSLFSLWAIFTS